MSKLKGEFLKRVKAIDNEDASNYETFRLKKRLQDRFPQLVFYSFFFNVFSICQDLIYNSSRGKFQTPKSLALAMTVRQLSGCSGLIRILNGLGHCISLSSTMAFDTALTQFVINTSDIIPREFAAK
jgi:hypothetical protein